MSVYQKALAILKPLRKPSTVCSTTDLLDYSVVHGCMEQVLAANYNDMVKLAREQDAPLLLVHMSDGWGSNINERVSEGSNVVRFVRERRRRADFLLERGHLEIY